MQVQSYFAQADSIDGELATLNLGPTHPATHGIFQNVLKMDGEKIVSAEPTIGYIHRAFEKLGCLRCNSIALAGMLPAGLHTFFDQKFDRTRIDGKVAHG